MHERQERRANWERVIAEGVQALPEEEIVALALGERGGDHAGKPIARALIDALGGVGGIARAGPALLAAQRGVGRVRALRLAAALELGDRARSRAVKPPGPLERPSDVAAMMSPRIGGLEHEELWVLAVDGANRLRGARCVARGGHHAVAVSTREILTAAVAHAASAFLLVHNHPSGDPKPSEHDVRMTEAVEAAARVLGMPLLDHVIVAASGKHASLR
jgi:DNA repair protein RadC